MSKRALFTFVTALLVFGAPAPFAQDGFGQGRNTALVRSSVLPADEAFPFNAFIEAPDTVILFWNINPGYYLYRDSIGVTLADGSAVDLGELPEAAPITDEFFGETRVYFDRLIHRFPLATLRAEDGRVSFTVNYQGCQKDTYCYPMQTKSIELPLP